MPGPARYRRQTRPGVRGKINITMGQEDYLKRQFDQLGKVLAKILSKLKDNDYSGGAAERIERISHELQEELGFDFFHLVETPQESLISLVKQEGKVREKNLNLLAEIFYEMAAYFDSIGHEEELRLLLYSRSLYLHEYLHGTASVYSIERQFRIDEIRKRLASF